VKGVVFLYVVHGAPIWDFGFWILDFGLLLGTEVLVQEWQPRSALQGEGASAPSQSSYHTRHQSKI
jgi:hypothetical protein